MKPSKKTVLTGFAMGFMFLFGVSISIVGVLLPVIIGEFEISLSTAGIITVAQNMGGILALVFCGYLSDRYGKMTVSAVLFALLAAALCATRLVGGFYGFVPVAFVIGMTASALNMSVSAYLAELYPERGTFFISMGSVYFGVGSVLGPVYVMLMNRFGVPWRIDFTALGVFCACILTGLLVVSMTGSGEKREKVYARAGSLSRWALFASKRLWWFAMIAFLYMANSSGFMAWTPTYLTDTGLYSDVFVNGAMTVFWISILLGRVLYMVFSDRMDQKRYVALGSLLGGIAVAVSLLARGIWIPVLYFAQGLTTGAVFHVCIAMVCQEYPEQSGFASSFVCLCASFGGTLSCWIAGALADGVGFVPVMLLFAIVLMIIPFVVRMDPPGGAIPH